mgnify:CR=1 FL=1
MSLLHSFYCWGAVGTILISTVFFLLFGIGSWKWLAVIFALIPAINIINFATCPIESLVEEGQGMEIRKLFSNPMFLIAIVMMVCSGASELAMAQWASAYAESALGFSKAVGDIAGPCMFAVTMGISRVLFGKAGDKMKLNRFMIGSGILCFVCYLLASFSENPNHWTCWMYCMWVFCRNHVARYNQHLFQGISNRRNCNVCTFSNGR